MALRARHLALACAAGLLFAGTALAHRLVRPTNREMVRLQGYLAAPPTGTQIKRELVIVAMGKEYWFYATDWRRFGVDEAQMPTPPPAGPFTLEASPDVLTRFANAGPGQRITILAEHRVGRRDLFILALDLCPQERRKSGGNRHPRP